LSVCSIQLVDRFVEIFGVKIGLSHVRVARNSRCLRSEIWRTRGKVAYVRLVPRRRADAYDCANKED
jgi:hypothetical protein